MGEEFYDEAGKTLTESLDGLHVAGLIIEDALEMIRSVQDMDRLIPGGILKKTGYEDAFRNAEESLESIGEWVAELKVETEGYQELAHMEIEGDTLEAEVPRHPGRFFRGVKYDGE